MNLSKTKKETNYLICESMEFQQPEIVGKDNKTGRVVIQVTLQDADVRNRNKRIYSKKVLENGLANPYVQERLATKSWYGEAGHPLKPDVQRQVYTDQSNISHIVTKVWWEGNKLKGLVEAANTARGRDFEGLILQGSKVAFSLRAIGPVTEVKGDTTYVKDPLTMYCFDWVIHPSHACAYMDKVISESGCVMLESGRTLDIQPDVFIPITPQEEDKYIRNESVDLRLTSRLFGSDKSTVLSESAVNNIRNRKSSREVSSLAKASVNNYLRML